MIECIKCHESKPQDAFFKAPANKSGYEGQCKTCRRKQQTAWQQANPHKVRAHAVKTKFGLTPAEYDAMREEQGDVCAICREGCATGRRLAVDHDHETGVVRGLLCHNCNTALGLLRDNTARLNAAVQYLRKVRS